MRLWRVSTHPTFDGEGARRFGGRWNRPGTSVIYCAATLALAMLELLMRLDRDVAPPEVVAYYADVPDEVATERVDAEALPGDWWRYPAPQHLQDLGSSWAASLSSLLLYVPSVVLGVSPQLVAGDRNVVVNPRHPDFPRVRARSVRLRLDPRLRR